MTPEEAYELAKYQRPGIRLLVGATVACEAIMAPLDPTLDLFPLHGYSSWEDYDLAARLGNAPSLFVTSFARAAYGDPRKASDDELRYLQGASLDAARQWLDAIRAKAEQGEQSK